MDTLSRFERSARMRLIHSRDTKPELVVRRMIHRMGYRFRLHGNLPGRPDLVFRSKARVIFVHGCFWHSHKNCGRTPKSRLEYWKPKLRRNVERDKEAQRQLRRLGWKLLVVWECELENLSSLARKVRKFLE